MSSLRIFGVVAVATVALSLSACAPAADDTEAAAGDGVFPVTIEHVYGTTTIESKPERVATVAWSNHEVPLALGIVPVGMSKVTWGDDDDNGVLPWVEDTLEELGAETPVLFDETDGIDFEAVADTEPDVILAAYSGLSQEEYDTLSKIAPVVAYPDVAWGASLSEMTLLNSKALGLEAEGEQLVADLESETDAALANHPELEGKKVLFSFIDPTDFSQIGFYTSHDTRPGFLADHGLPMPEIVTEESEGTDEFYVTVSSEEADRFSDVDVFVTYGDAGGTIVADLQADPLLSQIPAIAAGNIVVFENGTPLAASANPSPLSIGWGVDEYFGLLAAPFAG
ncbi:iron complex transport system substrate-binding protein [Conyzicola lurida]|uniref:Iron complex transport system substrate-binding protein n=1 Tax=Conyzicola lurida TaxID=1172621 RepID=A0A841ALS0_9MICO|nr:iron-siderophore ABC transporter substrate-binding protein [Conyzicola lurida]MBB5844157.1 iron complex transport system substrate-binding protein [Conyzicola lurida]